MVGPVLEAEPVQKLQSHGIALFARYALVIQRERDIFKCCLVADKIEGLEYEANHLVPRGGGFGFAHSFDEFSGKIIIAAVIIVENPENIQESGFSRA